MFFSFSDMFLEASSPLPFIFIFFSFVNGKLTITFLKILLAEVKLNHHSRSSLTVQTFTIVVSET
jgi:hypothetical protein